MSSHPQSVPPGRRAVDTRHLPNPASLPLQLQRAHTEVGLVDYHPHARDYSSHLAQPHRRRPSLLSEFQPGNERGQEQHIRFEHIYLPESNSQSEVEYAEIKRPRLEMGPESLMRHSAHRPPMPLGGAEDMAKMSPCWLLSIVSCLLCHWTSQVLVGLVICIMCIFPVTVIWAPTRYLLEMGQD